MTEETAKSVAESISAAWDSMQGEETPTEVEVTEVEETEEPKGPERDENGRFKAKEAPKEEPAEEAKEEAKEEQGEPEKEVDVPQYRAPPGWSVAAKAAFDTLPEPVKQAIAKREEEVSNGFKTYGEKTKAYEPLEQVLAPWRGRWQMEGQSEAQAINRLLSIQAAIEQDPQRGIAWLAQQYGVQLGNPQSAPQPAQSGDPRFNAVMQELQTLKRAWMAQQQAQSASQQQAVTAEIEAFKADPKNKWFDNVQAEMAALIKSGVAQSLQDAYDKACWSHPEVRTQLINEQRAQVQSQQRNTAQQAVQKAKQAAASVTGAPGGTTVQSVPPKSLRAQLEESYEASRIR